MIFNLFFVCLSVCPSLSYALAQFFLIYYWFIWMYFVAIKVFFCVLYNLFVVQYNTVEGAVHLFTGERAPSFRGRLSHDIQKKMHDTVRANMQDRLQEHGSTLMVHGGFLALAAKEK